MNTELTSGQMSAVVGTICALLVGWSVWGWSVMKSQDLRTEREKRFDLYSACVTKNYVNYRDVANCNSLNTQDK